MAASHARRYTSSRKGGTMRKLIFAALVAVLLPAAARAADDLDKATLGQHWYGPERTMDGLKGHIVLWENWGYN